MAEQVLSGSIGAMNSELSRFVLDDSDMLFHIKKTLQGEELVLGEEGEMKYTKGAGKAYPPKCVHFVVDAVAQALNKNMKLSNYKEKEIQRTAWLMCDDFVINLWLNMKELGVDALDIPILASMHRNYVDQAIRRPLNESDKRFLKETTSETTQRVQQDITEQQNKGGFLGIFNRGR